MSIDLTREAPITLNDAVKLFPKNARGKHVHASQLYRYASRGLRGVVLETVQAGAKKCTTRAAVFRFFERLTAASAGTPAPAAAKPSNLSKVDAELDAEGFAPRQKKPEGSRDE